MYIYVYLVRVYFFLKILLENYNILFYDYVKLFSKFDYLLEFLSNQIEEPTCDFVYS